VLKFGEDRGIFRPCALDYLSDDAVYSNIFLPFQIPYRTGKANKYIHVVMVKYL
jgi:hypothetical protein